MLERRALRQLSREEPPAADGRQSRVLITAALTELALQGREAAFDTLDLARRVAPPDDRDALAACCELQRAAIHVWCGEWTQAEQALEAVRPHLDKLTAQERCAALLNGGLARLSLGLLGGAQDDLDEAARLARAHGLTAQEFKAQHNLGCLAYVSGDLPKALRSLREARALGAEVTTTRTDLDLGEVLYEAGLLDDAEEVVRDALRRSRSDSSGIERGEAHLLLARCALVRDDLTAAREHTRKAAVAFRSRGAEARVEHATLFGAYLDVLRGRFTGASRSVLQDLPHRIPLTPENANLAWRLSIEHALTRGNVEDAAALLARPRGSTRTPGLVEGLSLRLIRAQVALASGNRVAARREVRAAAADAATAQSGSSSLDVRSGLAAHGRRLQAFDLRLAHETGRADVIFRAAERWRAGSMRTIPPWSHDLETIALRAELRRLRLAMGAHPATTEKALSARARHLERAIVARHREVSGATQIADLKTPSPALLRRQLEARTLSCFHAHDGILYRVDVGAESTRLHCVGDVRMVDALADQLARDLADLPMARRHEALGHLVRRAIASTAAQLDKILLDELVLPPHGVVIVPTRTLHTLAWSLLPSLADAPVVIAPSASLWLRRSAQADTERPAGPASAGADVRVCALRGPGLRHASQEVDAVAAAWASTAPTWRPAGIAQSPDFIDGLLNADLVHIAAHGRHDSQNPLFSSLLADDGPFFAYDVPEWVTAGHVVLSACELGRSHVRPGDEPLGFAAALLTLGVSSVVAAVAPIPDESASEVMGQYHGYLADGVPAATSLRRAINDVPEGAALCLFGIDWQARGAGRAQGRI